MDTSVIIAASTPSDLRHEACLDVLEVGDAEGAVCAAHTLAEVYSIMTGRPRPLRVPPDAAARLVAHTSKRFTIVSLDTTEYVRTVQNMATLGRAGGMVYDALLLACARKANVSRIFTLNRKHLVLVAPDLASIVIEP